MSSTSVRAHCLAAAVSVFSAGIHAQVGDLVALGCNPASPDLGKPKSADAYRTAPRQRYVFMWREPSGEISKLCIDELGTDETQPTTCVEGDELSSGASEISAYFFAGFVEITIYRADASMRTKLWKGEDQNYSCAPSKDAFRVLKFVSQEKQRQKSANLF